MAKAEVARWGILAFLAGDFFANSNISLLPSAVAVLAAVIIVAIFSPRYIPVLIIVPGVFIGCWYYYFLLYRIAANTNIPTGREVHIQGVVIDEPGASAAGQSLLFRVEPPYHGTVRALVRGGDFAYGDEVSLSGKVEPGVRGSPGNMFYPRTEKTAIHRASIIKESILKAKQRILAPLSEFLPAEEAAFMGGLTFGAKSQLGAGLTADLRASGTTHVVAISGYNVQLITVAAFGLLLRVMRRRIAFFVILFLLAIFGVMVGGTPSVIRAAIMGSLFLLSKQIGRAYSFDYAIVWAAFCMVLLDPGTLVTPGFALSFGSLLGIAYVAPAILRALRKEDATEDSLLTVAVQTFAAGISVLPVTLGFFGRFSLTSFFANIAILPFIPVTTFFGFVLCGIGIVAPTLGFATAWIAHILLAYELAVIHFFARATVPLEIANFSVFAGCVYYLGLAGFIWYAQSL